MSLEEFGGEKDDKDYLIPWESPFDKQRGLQFDKATYSLPKTPEQKNQEKELMNKALSASLPKGEYTQAEIEEVLFEIEECHKNDVYFMHPKKRTEIIVEFKKRIDALMKIEKSMLTLLPSVNLGEVMSVVHSHPDLVSQMLQAKNITAENDVIAQVEEYIHQSHAA